MDMLFFYRKFFVNLYSQAGLDRAHEQITRVINLYEVKLFLEGEIEKNKRRASRSSKFITLERAVGVDDPAKRNRRQIKNLHIQRGRDRSTCRLYEDKLTQLPDFDAWLATLPAVVFLQNDLPLEHEVPPPKQLRGRRLLIGGI